MRNIALNVGLARGIITPKELSAKFDRYVSYGLEDEHGTLVAITSAMLTELTGIGHRRVHRILTELGFKIERRVREMYGIRVRGRFLYVENTHRWVEAWRRYRYGETVMAIPDMLRTPDTDYTPLSEFVHEYATPEELIAIEKDADSSEDCVICEVLQLIRLQVPGEEREVCIPAGLKLKMKRAIAAVLEDEEQVRIVQEC